MDIAKETKELNKQLYPNGRAWAYIRGSEQVNTEITRFVDGLGNPFVDGFGNAFISKSSAEASPGKRLNNAFLKSYEKLYSDIYSLLNQILADNEGFDETDASNWERVFGLSNIGLTLDERKANILRKQGYPNGVAERGNYLFIQDQLQAAGFDVYLHENRFADGSGGWNVVDPDSVTAGIGDATYTGQSLDISSELIIGNGLYFGADGLKLFTIGEAVPETVFQYSLTTAYDLTTASYDSVSLDVSGQVTDFMNIKFKPNGLKMYVVGDGSIFQYSLSTAWDLSTASYDGVSYTPTEAGATDIYFKNDGLKLFVLNEANETVYQYVLGTAWDFSTITYDNKLYDLDSETPPFLTTRCIYFSEAGGSLYVGGAGSQIYQYNLSTPFDITTASVKDSLGTSPTHTGTTGIYINPEQLFIFFLGLNEVIYKYTNSVETYDILANYIDKSIDNNFFSTQPTIPTELGDCELGDCELGSTAVSQFDELLRFTFFVGGATFPDRADIPAERENEFRELLLKLKPAQMVGYLFLNYI
jgi:hypothetical protein